MIETVLSMLALIVALVYPSLGSRSFEKAEGLFSELSRRRGLSLTVVGLAALLLRIAVLPVEPIPEPAVHDEFAYLLQADTFAHGRLANPTHPMWIYFETFHVIQQPTYCAKFFPAQGMFLAIGRVLFGHPFWGVWLSGGLMCVAITWMLQNWLGPEWALLGGMLVVLRFAVFSYWGNSYWGGNVAAIGGALVLGALPPIKSSQRIKDALLMGLGLALLANNRPWEGLVLSLPVAVMLVSWMVASKRPAPVVSLRRIVLPLSIVLGLTAAWLAYYCWRTTGSPFRTPYQVYDDTYSVSPYMIWQHVKPEPVYRHEVMRKLEVGEALENYRAFFSPLAVVSRVCFAGSFFLGPVLILPFLVLALSLPYGFSWSDIPDRPRTLLILLFIFAAGTELATFYSPHYSAPATCLIVALVLFAMRRIRHWHKFGLFLTRAIPVLCLAIFVLRAAAVPLHVPINQFGTYHWYQFFQVHPRGWFPRAAIRAELEGIPGNHLVVVRYGPAHQPFFEWVYNDANIDTSKVVWARDMGEHNDQLLRYFAGRRVWLVEPDVAHPTLLPYASNQLHQTPGR